MTTTISITIFSIGGVDLALFADAVKLSGTGATSASIVTDQNRAPSSYVSVNWLQISLRYVYNVGRVALTKGNDVVLTGKIKQTEKKGRKAVIICFTQMQQMED